MNQFQLQMKISFKGDNSTEINNYYKSDKNTFSTFIILNVYQTASMYLKASPGGVVWRKSIFSHEATLPLSTRDIAKFLFFLYMIVEVGG